MARWKFAGREHKKVVGKKSDGMNASAASVLRAELIKAQTDPNSKQQQQSKLTLREAIEQAVTQRLVENKAKPYEPTRVLTKHFASLLNMKVTDIKREHIVNELSAGWNLANATQRKNLEVLRSLFNRLVRAKILNANPTDGINIKKENNERERFLNRDEVQDLLRRAGELENKEFWLFCVLSLTTGARVSSVLALRYCDVDLTNASVNIPNIKGGGHYYKGFLNDEALLALKGADTTSTKPLIQTPRRTVERELKKLLEPFNAGLMPSDRKRRAVIHTLRHTFASHLAIKGVPIFTIKKLLDHKDIKDTMRLRIYTLVAIMNRWRKYENKLFFSFLTVMCFYSRIKCIPT